MVTEAIKAMEEESASRTAAALNEPTNDHPIHLHFLLSGKDVEKDYRDVSSFLHTAMQKLPERFSISIVCRQLAPSDVLSENWSAPRRTYYYALFGETDDNHIVSAVARIWDKCPDRLYVYTRSADVWNKPLTKLCRKKESVPYPYADANEIELNILLELAGSCRFSDRMRLRNGKLYVASADVLPLDKNPYYKGSSQIQRLRRSYNEIKNKNEALHARASISPATSSDFSRLVRASVKEEDIQKDLYEQERIMLQLLIRRAKASRIDKRRKSLELDFQEWMRAEGVHKASAKILSRLQDEDVYNHAFTEARARAADYISCYQGIALNLKADGINKMTIPEICTAYEKAVDLAKDFQIKEDVIYEYAEFLYAQKAFPAGLHFVEYEICLLGLSDNTGGVEMAEALRQKGDLLYGNKEYDQAEKLLADSLALYSRSDRLMDEHTIKYLHTCNDYATVLWKRKKTLAAEEVLLNTLDKIRNLREDAENQQTEYRVELSDSYNRLGTIHNAQKRLRHALESHRRALELRRELMKEDPERYIEAYTGSCNNMAFVYRRLEEYERAEALYLEAIDIREKAAKTNPDAFSHLLSLVQTNYAILLREWGPTHYDAAEEYFKKAKERREALVEADENLYRVRLANTCAEYGELCSLRGELEDGLKLFHRAIEVFREEAAQDHSANDRDYAQHCFRYGLLLDKWGDHTQALEYLSTALQIQRELFRNNEAAYAFELLQTEDALGEVYQRRGDSEGAKTALSDAQSCCSHIMKFEVVPALYAEAVISAQNRLAELFENSGALSKAKQCRKKAEDAEKVAAQFSTRKQEFL